ncbi:MAG: toprim domain-containing protein [Candidatus Nanoarchaeia archaeon]
MQATKDKKTMSKKTDVLSAVEKAINRNFIVIVEGYKDKTALEQLGFKNIIVFQGKPRYKKFEEIIDLVNTLKTEVIILTDLDKKGKQFYSIIKKELLHQGIKINNKLRNLLIKERISHIEGLATFVKHN